MKVLTMDAMMKRKNLTSDTSRNGEFSQENWLVIFALIEVIEKNMAL